MMKVLLDKLIKKLIIGEYPFIEDFEIKVDVEKIIRLKKLGGGKKIALEYYTINYTVTPDENGEFPYDNEFKEITELTETCFKGLGPEHYQRFVGVEFYSEED
jgi:hypothetical protein